MEATTVTVPLVFVYGTLKSGHGNHRLLRGAESLGRALVHGVKIGHLGSLPAAVRESDDDVVARGELYKPSSSAQWESLDRLEGHPRFYRREVVSCVLPDKSVVDAWCYLLSHPERVSGPWVETWVPA